MFRFILMTILAASVVIDAMNLEAAEENSTSKFFLSEDKMSWDEAEEVSRCFSMQN